MPEATRRSFLGAAALAPAILNARNASGDPVRIGLIGAGGRGTYLLDEIAKCEEPSRVVAVCDVWSQAREKAAATVTRMHGRAPALTSRYQELLANKDVEAVIVAAPDFTHSVILKEAIQAGKDVYCEKPMGTDFAEAKAAYLAVKASKQVVQIGTQRRSDPGLIAVAGLMRNGVIGKVTRADLQVHFQEQRWRRDYHQIDASQIDWDAFSFGRNVPKDLRHWREWQLFRETSNGIPGLWMSHLIDLAAWFLDDPYPQSAVALGGVYLWHDGRQTQDVFQALLAYPKECLVSFSMSLTNSGGNRNLWFGTKGTLDGDKLRITGEGSTMPDRLLEPVEVKPVPVESHMANFLRCVRSRQTPRADIQAGFSHAVADCMAVAAYETGKRIGFDAQKLELTQA
jgi:predicted dehydrogenase